MAATATLEFSSPNPVTVDWGDGSTERHPAAPDGTTITHGFPGEGRWWVTVTDTVTFQRSRQRVKCPTCIIDPVHITLNPQVGTNISWTTTQPVVNNLGAQIRFVRDPGPYSTYNINSGSVQSGTWNANSPPGTFGPWRMSFTAVNDTECQAVVTGGNDPRRPGLDTFVLEAVLDNVTGSCFTGSNGGDKLRLRGNPAGGPAWENATWTVDWGDGLTQRGKKITWSVPLLHEYAPPGGQVRTITVTNEQTTLTRQYTGIGCPPPVTGANASGSGMQGTWTPTGSRAPISLSDLRAIGVAANPSTSWFYFGSWVILQDAFGLRVIWDGSRWVALASTAYAGEPGHFTRPDTGATVTPSDPEFIAPPTWSFVSQAYGPPSANPSVPWSTGQYVVLGDGTNMYWRGPGTGWTQGIAP